MFEQSYFYQYHQEVLTCEVPTSMMLEKFDNWLYNVRKYDRADQPGLLLSHLFEVYRADYAAYVYVEGFNKFQEILAVARIAAPRPGRL